MPASIKICTRRSFRNRRGVCFLKSWAAQRPRGPISEIEEAFAFSKAGLLRDHESRSQKSKKHLLFQPRQHLSHAQSALRKLRALCQRFLAREFRSSSYPTITHKGKGTAPLLDNWKVPMCVDLRVLRQDRTRRKRAVSRNLKSNLQFGTDCLEPLPGCLLSIALEYSSSTAVKVTNSTGKYLMTVDQILALYTEAAKRG
ncbi:hypothetical protein PS1_019255 [Malus domestica]